MNLMDDPWLPVRRHSGVRERICPWQLTEQIDTDPVLALDLPRADFNASLIQFLIGLLQTAWAPENDIEWGRAYEQPPTSDTLREACQRYRDAFEFDGASARFLQDLTLRDEVPRDIAALLIDEPGGQTLRENRDLFIKRDQYPALGMTAAIAALITLQTNAPSGGKGHRTSLRGGGPLTTLVVPDPLHDPLPTNLWRLIWLNVLPTEAIAGMTGNDRLTTINAIFPWMAETRTSEAASGVDTTPEEAHPLQMYWGMPRRIRLNLDDLAEGECPLILEQGPLVTSYQTRSYGVNYTGAWAHPLSPHTRSNEGQPLPLHPQPGGIGYRHWLGFVLGDEHGISPAQVVRQLGASRRRGRRRTRLWAFGYDMDNMKARGWYESVMPFYHLDDDVRDYFVASAKDALFVAEQVVGNLRSALKQAWFDSGATVHGDFGFVTETFWQDTEADFFTQMDMLYRHLTNAGDEPDWRAWLNLLNRVVLRLFDGWAASGDIAAEDPKRIAVARRNLIYYNHSKKILNRLGLESDAA